jgi:Na+/alanine symporter
MAGNVQKGGIMTKEAFRNHVVLSAVLTLAVIAVIVGFSVVMFHWYAQPDGDNTFVVKDTVLEVYHAKREIVIEMENEEAVKFVYPWGIQNLYSTIGYDVSQLADLLEGEAVECLRMDHLPWAVEIKVGDTIIDNRELTGQETVVTRVGVVILGLLMLAFTIAIDAVYLKERYRRYLKSKKKQERKAKRKRRNGV